MTMRALLRLLVAATIGLAAASLVSCGGAGKGLIPEANAGPLRSDFEAVAQAAQAGNGSCATTETALGKTEKDFLALPAGVDRGLRDKLGQGISNLRRRALAMCSQAVSTVSTTTSTQTTPTTPTQTTTTTPASTPTSTQPPPNQGGGTAAPGEGAAEEPPGKGKGKGKDEGEAESESGGEARSGGASAGGSK
jgi:hypothetical protein